MNISQIIIRPVVTEKSTAAAAQKLYTFEVHADANKHQVAQAVATLFDVTVSTVRMSIRKGKDKRVGRRMKTKTMPDRKHALVQVTKGTIDLFPQS